MKILAFFIFICFIIGCATHYQGTPDECRTDSCISQKKTEDFCNKIRQEGAFCVEFQISDFCVITGSKKQEIRTPCLDSLVYKEILDVFDGKWAGGGTVGTVRPSSEPTEVGPYWVDGVGYGQSSFIRDIVQGEAIYHYYCRSKNNQNCDMIFNIHTDGGPIYQYNYETKEIKSVGWPM